MPEYRAAVICAALENIQREGLPASVVCDTTPIMAPNERLKAWLAAAKVSQAEMARRCGYDRSNFHRLLAGAVNPTLTLAARIERETSGAIPAVDWADLARKAA